MKKELIYKKKYEYKEIYEEISDLGLPDELTLSAEDYLNLLEEVFNKTEYVLIPRRIDKSKEFIKAATSISQMYEIDTEIYRNDGCITVIYAFDALLSGNDIGQLFNMADKIFFFRGDNDFNFTVTLDFYTHAVIRNGKVVEPDIELSEIK